MAGDNLYFAYGSNLHRPRMARRVTGSEWFTLATLRGWRLECNKLGKDGSGKANLVAHGPGEVWGVVYRLPKTGLSTLDRIEGDYVRQSALVVAADGTQLAAHTYRSDRLTNDPRPYCWYLALMMDAARRFGFPDAYIDYLTTINCRAW